MTRLSSYSLVEFSASIDSVHIHPLIHYWARLRLPADQRNKLSRDSLELLLRALHQKSGSLPSQHAFEVRLLPHVQAVLSNIQEYSSGLSRSEYEEYFGLLLETTKRAHC